MDDQWGRIYRKPFRPWSSSGPQPRNSFWGYWSRFQQFARFGQLICSVPHEARCLISSRGHLIYIDMEVVFKPSENHLLNEDFRARPKGLSANADNRYLMFEQLPTVPTSQELLDKSFRRASRATDNESMVQNAGNILSDNLTNLVRKFPSFENLPPFYREMADIIAGVDRMRISLSRMRWAARQIRLITREYVVNIKRARGMDSTPDRKSAFGRYSSVMRSIEKDLLFLNEATK